MVLTERQKNILAAIIQEYVATAEPVSSGELVRRYELPYSPATVRNEMLELDREGFISQPHTSSGRVPADRGYRFFIEHCIKINGAEDRRFKHSFAALQEIDDEFEFLRQTSRILSGLSEEFSMAGFWDKNIFYKSGISEVLQYPEFDDDDTAHEFGELADFLDEEIKSFFSAGEISEPKVFIGKENPIREARNYTMIVSSAKTPFGEDGFFTILGPRRMDYEKNLAILRLMRRVFSE